MFIELWDTEKVQRIDWRTYKEIDGMSIIYGFIDKHPEYTVSSRDDYLNKIITIRNDTYFLNIKCTRNQFKKIMEEIE